MGVYLSGYGASSLELFRLQYLAAGVWCALAFLVFYLAIEFLHNLLKDLDPLRRLRPVTRAVVTEVLSFAALLVALLLTRLLIAVDRLLFLSRLAISLSYTA